MTDTQLEAIARRTMHALISSQIPQPDEQYDVILAALKSVRTACLAIVQAEAYLPKFAPGSEDDPCCDGCAAGWCQSAVDAVCDVRNRTLAAMGSPAIPSVEPAAAANRESES